jgi:hypothetical protein
VNAVMNLRVPCNAGRFSSSVLHLTGRMNIPVPVSAPTSAQSFELGLMICLLSKPVRTLVALGVSLYHIRTRIRM